MNLLLRYSDYFVYLATIYQYNSVFNKVKIKMEAMSQHVTFYTVKLISNNGKQSKWTQLTSSVHNKTVHILFEHFQLKYIHIYTYFVKKQDFNQIFRLRLKISWEGILCLLHLY